jgi:hypothetical protein
MDGRAWKMDGKAWKMDGNDITRLAEKYAKIK